MLRKIILLWTILCTGIYAFAQNKKGDILISAYIDPMVTRKNTIAVAFPGESENMINIRTEVKAGYYIINRLCAGVSAGYNNQSVRNTYYNSRYYDVETLAGIFARYTLPIKKFGLFGEVSYRWGNAQGKFLAGENRLTGEFQEATYNSPVNAYNIGVGINYLVSRKLALELILQQETGEYTKNLLPDRENPNKFSNGGLLLGVVYFIHTKRK